MILELDCGNSLIKWRVVIDGRVHVEFTGVAFEEKDLIARLDQAFVGAALKMIRVVSVRSEQKTKCLLRALGVKYSAPVLLAKSTRELAGVTNGYQDSGMLGVDRWLAIVAAYKHVKSACLVLDVGTAATADFVSSVGVHLGGCISPGLKLMRKQLGEHTGQVGFVSDDTAVGNGPGRSTTEAVLHGTEMMLLGYVDRQIQMAQGFWGDAFSIVLTGGDAALIETHFNKATYIPDLVFRGLALACPD